MDGEILARDSRPPGDRPARPAPDAALSEVAKLRHRGWQVIYQDHLGRWWYLACTSVIRFGRNADDKVESREDSWVLDRNFAVKFDTRALAAHKALSLYSAPRLWLVPAALPAGWIDLGKERP